MQIARRLLLPGMCSMLCETLKQSSTIKVDSKRENGSCWSEYCAGVDRLGIIQSESEQCEYTNNEDWIKRGELICQQEMFST